MDGFGKWNHGTAQSAIHCKTPEIIETALTQAFHS